MKLLIILLIAMAICFLIMVIAFKCDFPVLGIGSLITYIFLCIVTIAVGATTETKEPNHIPTTLDVHRGKTTLEITYRDSVAIDSTVVYKVR